MSNLSEYPPKEAHSQPANTNSLEVELANRHQNNIAIDVALQAPAENAPVSTTKLNSPRATTVPQVHMSESIIPKSIFSFFNGNCKCFIIAAAIMFIVYLTLKQTGTL